MSTNPAARLLHAAGSAWDAAKDEPAPKNLEEATCELAVGSHSSADKHADEELARRLREKEGMSLGWTSGGWSTIPKLIWQKGSDNFIKSGQFPTWNSQFKDLPPDCK